MGKETHWSDGGGEVKKRIETYNMKLVQLFIALERRTKHPARLKSAETDY